MSPITAASPRSASTTSPKRMTRIQRPRKLAPKVKVQLRPVYMVYPALFPLLMMNYWIRRSETPIVGILVSDYDIKHKGKYLNFFELVLGLGQETGWPYTLMILFTAKFAVPIVRAWNFFRKLMGKEIKIKTYDEIAKEKGIPIYRSKNFNSEEVRAFLGNVNANLIVSAYNNQILKKSTFDLPKYKAVNIHPGLLPNFRGLDGPFEAMYHKVSHAGVTIHWVDKGIDTGKVIVQERIKIRSTDSLFSLSMRCWMHGATLLEKVFEQIKSGTVTAIRQNPKDLKYPYQSFPQKQKVREVLTRGRRLFTWRDLRNTFKD